MDETKGTHSGKYENFGRKLHACIFILQVMNKISVANEYGPSVSRMGAPSYGILSSRWVNFECKNGRQICFSFDAGVN